MNLVLAHGFLGFRRKFGMDYFNGVEKFLTQTFNAKVLVTQVDPDGGIAQLIMRRKLAMISIILCTRRASIIFPSIAKSSSVCEGYNSDSDSMRQVRTRAA